MATISGIVSGHGLGLDTHELPNIAENNHVTS